jgi:diguanylate cyclase (GGDEF)-like protein
LDLSPHGNGRIYLVTIVGTLICIGVALFVDSFNFATMTTDGQFRALLTDILLPAILAAPIIFFFMSKLRDLAVAQERLTIFASTDPLTGVLNRSAFTAVVERRLGQVTPDGLPARGALLILDADNFKAINDTFGHPEGDVALKLITAAVSGVLRKSDIMGRIGGEEFGIFLPDAALFTAEAVAERIRHAVDVTEFMPNGTPHQLSVSIGGAVFDRKLTLTDLLRVADQQLYVAKQNGRNRVSVSPIKHYDSVPAAAA